MTPTVRRRLPLVLAASGGIVFALTSPPTDIYPAVIVGLALLAASIACGAVAVTPTHPTPKPPAQPVTATPTHPTPKPPAQPDIDRWPDPPTFWRAFGRGALWGTSAGVVGLRFVPAVIQRFTPLGVPASLLALLLLAAGQSLIWAIGAGVAAVLHRRARLPFELAFGAGVFVALSLPTIFAWSPAGLVSPWPSFVQLADVIGERGVSVLFAIGAALFARAGFAIARGRRSEARRPALAAAAIFVALPIHGAIRMATIARGSAGLPTMRVALVDQAVDPIARWNAANHPTILRTLHELTRQAEAKGAELTIWPEAAYPYLLDHDTRTDPKGRVAMLGRDVRGPLLIGLITEDKPTQLASGQFEMNLHNSATIVMPDGTIEEPYDKVHLLWFGETVPGGEQFPWLRRLFQRSGGLVAGKEPRALDLPPPADGRPALHLAVLNCYEDTLADVGRHQANALGPNLLVNVTNDAWFYATAEPELHARLAAMRAIELRLDLVRAVNMGVASWVDAAGVVRERYAAEAQAVIMTTPAIRAAQPTLYARFGDVPVLVLLAASAAFFARRARRDRRDGEQPPPAVPSDEATPRASADP